MPGETSTPDKIKDKEGENTTEKGADKGRENNGGPLPGVEPEGGEAPQNPTPSFSEELRRSNEVLTRAMDLIEVQQKKIEEMEGKLAAYDLTNLRRLEDRVGELTDRLPKTLRDEKAQIKGYYDFEGMGRKYANEATEVDYREAKNNMDAIIRGTINN